MVIISDLQHKHADVPVCAPNYTYQPVGHRLLLLASQSRMGFGLLNDFPLFCTLTTKPLPASHSHVTQIILHIFCHLIHLPSLILCYLFSDYSSFMTVHDSANLFFDFPRAVVYKLIVSHDPVCNLIVFNRAHHHFAQVHKFSLNIYVQIFRVVVHVCWLASRPCNRMLSMV